MFLNRPQTIPPDDSAQKPNAENKFDIQNKKNSGDYSDVISLFQLYFDQMEKC